MTQNHLESLLKWRLLGLIPRFSDSVDLVWGLRISISNKFPHDANTVDPGTNIEGLEHHNYRSLAFGERGLTLWIKENLWIRRRKHC